MRKPLLFLLALLLLLSLCACAGAPAQPEAAPASSAAAQESPAQEPQEAPVSTADTPSPKPEAASPAAGEESPAQEPQEAPVSTADAPFPAPEATASPFKDGTYTAYASDEDARALLGWRDYMIITFQDGSIADIQLDSLNSAGALKSQVSEADYPMSPHPSQWIPRLLAQVWEASKGADIEGISGATISSSAARSMFDAILQAAEAGDTEPIQIP